MLEVTIDESIPLETCVAALRKRPSSLLVDVDGTISPIVDDPLSAYVLPGCRDALGILASRLDLVGVVSGRAADRARLMVGLDSIEYWGGHGATHLTKETIQVAPEAQKFIEAAEHVQHAIMDWDLPSGILVEPKGTSVAVHYRQALDPAQARDSLYARLSPLAKSSGLDLLEGRRVFELRPPGMGKGRCIEQVIHERGLSGVVYVGDDQTDVEAFAAVETWRNTGPDRAGVTVAVKNPEATKRLFRSADYLVDGVQGVERLLQGLAQRF